MKLRKMTSWLRALRERRGGCGTRSGFSASFGDFGMIGPFGASSLLRPNGIPLFWFLSVTGSPLYFGLAAV
ncbi:hypothetical protein D3C87_1801670 [compost metagenome]